MQIVLAGNPNVGKSIFFKSLTGIYAEVSNFPGTTVDIMKGRYKNAVIYDTPGIYGVSSFNDEELAARDIILKSDVIINVADGMHLPRDLFLTQQLIDMEKPMILCINMMDEVTRHHIHIDAERLSGLLGIPVILTAAAIDERLTNVKKALPQACVGKKVPEIEILYCPLLPATKGSCAEALLLLEDDAGMLAHYGMSQTGRREQIYRLRRKRVDEIISRTVKKEYEGDTLSERLSRFLLRPLTGIPVMLLVLGSVFLFLGCFIAQVVVRFTEEILMQGCYVPMIQKLTEGFVLPESALGKLLIGEYGILTMVPTYIVGLLLPMVAGFYFLLALLEDSGYLPRLAVLSDRLLSKIGLNGKAVIPLILGFGCVTAATVSTRVLGTRRERIIATALLGLTIPCSAQLGILLASAGQLGSRYLCLYIGLIIVIFLAAGRVLNRILPEESGALLLDLPALRLPRLKNITRKTILKTGQFLSEALPVFILGGFLITFMELTGLLERLVQLFAPIVTGGLRLPPEAAVTFMMGIIRRDFGAAGLFSLSLTSEQTLVSMVTMTLFVPCIASVVMIFKERSLKEAICIWLSSFILAFGVGTVTAVLLALI